MLKFDDFFHLPQLDNYIAQLVADRGGTVVVAGLDPRPGGTTDTHGEFVPSGRATIFRVLVSAILASAPKSEAVMVTEDQATVRRTRQVRQLRVQPSHSYADRIAEATRQKPDLLVVDHLSAASAEATFAAAHSGLRVVSQLDTVFRGAAITRHLRDLGASLEHLTSLRWVIAVQRCATLCPH